MRCFTYKNWIFKKYSDVLIAKVDFSKIIMFYARLINRCFLIETVINKNMERLLKMSNYENWTHGCRMHSADYVQLINILTTSTLGSKISPADQRARNLIYHFYYSLSLNGNLNRDFWVRLMDNSRDPSPSYTFLSIPIPIMSLVSFFYIVSTIPSVLSFEAIIIWNISISRNVIKRLSKLHIGFN